MAAMRTVSERRGNTAVTDGPIGTRAAHAYVQARLPGWPLSLRTFEYHLARGHIPALRLGSRYLLWTRELDGWLASRGRPRATDATP